MNFIFLLLYLVIHVKFSDQCPQAIYKTQISRTIYNFAMRLLRETAKESTHFVMSPAALWHDLTFISKGASGLTRDEMLRLLRPPKRKCGAKTLRHLYDGLKHMAYDLESRRCVGVAVGAGTNLTTAYKRHLRLHSGVLLLDLEGGSLNDDYETVNGLISGIVERNFTDYLDRRFFGPSSTSIGVFDVDIFKASMKVPLKLDGVVTRPFYDETGLEIRRVSMVKVAGPRRFADVPQVRARVVEIPLDATRKFSLIVFLPEKDVTVREVLNGLVDLPLELVLRMFSNRRVELLMPLIDVTTKVDLKSTLKALGVEKMFKASAQFPDVGSGELFISSLWHFSEIQIYKEDVEPKETGTDFDYNSVSYEANKPFLFYVIDTFYNTIVYSGIYSAS